MPRGEILCTPVGELRDMIACLQIAAGTASPVVEADMDELMNLR